MTQFRLPHSSTAATTAVYSQNINNVSFSLNSKCFISRITRFQTLLHIFSSYLQLISYRRYQIFSSCSGGMIYKVRPWRSHHGWTGGAWGKLTSIGEHRSIYVHYSEIKSDINDLMYLVSVPLPLSPSLLSLSLLTYLPKLIMSLSVTFSIIGSSSQ